MSVQLGGCTAGVDCPYNLEGAQGSWRVLTVLTAWMVRRWCRLSVQLGGCSGLLAGVDVLTEWKVQSGCGQSLQHGGCTAGVDCPYSLEGA